MQLLPRVQASYAISIFSTIVMFYAGIWAKYLKGEENHSLDVDLIVMINFIKLHMLAVNYDNAGKLDDPALSKHFTARERHYAENLRKPVPLYDFFQYFLFCASSYSGMVHEYRDFHEYINQEKNYSNIPRSKLWGPAFLRFAQIPFWGAVMITTDIFFPKSFLITEEYAAWSFLFKASYLICACMVKLFMLVLGFTAMESNFIACG